MQGAREGGDGKEGERNARGGDENMVHSRIFVAKSIKKEKISAELSSLFEIARK